LLLAGSRKAEKSMIGISMLVVFGEWLSRGLR
jgi:hypothetical protein